MPTEADLAEATASAGVPVDPIVAPDSDEWIPGTQLVDPADSTLTDLIGFVMERRGVEDREVAVMLGWKAVSYLAAVLPLGIWSRLDAVPDMHVHNLAVRVDPGVRFALRELRFRDSGRGRAADAVEVWWDGLMAPLIERWRAEARVARRGLEAFAVSQAVTIVGRGVEGDLDDSHRRIEMFVDALPTRLRPMAKVMEYRSGDGPWGTIGERTSCCLQYKLPAGNYCITCNLLDDDERTVLIKGHGDAWRRPHPSVASPAHR